MLVGVGAERQRLGLGLALGQDDRGLGTALEADLLGLRLGGGDRHLLLALGPLDRGFRLGLGGTDGRGEELLLGAIRLQERQLGLLLDDRLLGGRLGERPRLGGGRLGRLHLLLDLGLLQGDVSLGVDLDLLCLGLPDGGLLVGRRLRHPGVALDDGKVLLAEQPDVVRLVGETLDGEGVDLEARGRQVALGGVLHLLEQLLAVADQLLDGQGADDGAQRALEHVLDDGVDLLVLGVQEALGGVPQRLHVAADLEGRHTLDLHLDALAGDRILELDGDLPGGQLQPPDPVPDRDHEGAAADHDLDAAVAGLGHDLALLVTHLGALRAGHDDRLIGVRHLVAAGHVGEKEDDDDDDGDCEQRTAHWLVPPWTLVARTGATTTLEPAIASILTVAPAGISWSEVAVSSCDWPA